jgi:hypothetical protein
VHLEQQLLGLYIISPGGRLRVIDVICRTIFFIIVHLKQQLLGLYIISPAGRLRAIDVIIWRTTNHFIIVHIKQQFI